MTKRHFQAMARALHASKREAPGLLAEGADRATRAAWNRQMGAHVQWSTDVQAMGDVCRQANPNFDRERFVEACETGATRGMKQ